MPSQHLLPKLLLLNCKGISTAQMYQRFNTKVKLQGCMIEEEYVEPIKRFAFWFLLLLNLPILTDELQPTFSQ